MQAFYINLARRTDRRARMEQLLAERGIAADRIEAITPADLSDEQIQRYTAIGNLHNVTPAELSCSLSHHLALRRFLESGDTHALIMEDDIVISKQVPALLKAIPPQCDILRLETFMKTQHTWVKPDCQIGPFTLHRVDSICYGTAAYVVSRRAALALVEHQQSLAFPYDHVLCNPYRLPCSRLKILQVNPAVARQMDRDPAGLYTSDVQVRAGTVPAKPFPVSMLHGMVEFWQREIRMGIPKTLRQLLGHTRRGIVPFDMDQNS